MPDPKLPDAPVDHVAHLVPDLATGATPPVALGYPTPLSPTQRMLSRVVLLVATGLGVVPLILLWTVETPGLWFSLLFTVFIGVLLVGAWLIVAGTRATGRERVAAAARWAAVRDDAVASPGRVVDRRVSLTDSGEVSGFVVQVVGEEGLSLVAGWAPHPSRSDYLLQPQVPGIGAHARIWSVPSHPGSPVVVDVVDPTRTG